MATDERSMSTSTPHPDDSVTCVFGLTKSQLGPILASIAGEPVASFDVSVEHHVPGYYGYSAEKVIPTFSYTTRSGVKGRETVFVKWFHEPGPQEAHHYAYLAERGAPIPPMYGTLVGPDRREMIFLEYLEPIGDVCAFKHFLDDPERFRQFLAVLARFNAIEPCGDYAAQLDRGGAAEDLQGAISTLDRIWEQARARELGHAVQRLCLACRDKLPALRALAGEVIERAARMEIGFGHRDYYEDSTAWRRGKRELLIIDLESVGFAPRFYDVAYHVGAPDDIEPRCLPREELARHYLDQYVRWGGCRVPLESFLEDAHLLWVVHKFTMLFFPFHRALDGRVDWTENRELARQQARGDLYVDLIKLLRQVGWDGQA